jgi:hypothetical protein
VGLIWSKGAEISCASILAARLAQISNHQWRWNANLDGQHPWAMGNDLSLLGIHMHFTLGTPHLVGTCLIFWAGTHVGSTIVHMREERE